MEDGLSLLLHTAGAAEYVSTLRNAGATLSSLQATLEDGRPALLAALKSLGVGALPSRQSIANALQRFARTGAFRHVTVVEDGAQDPGPAPAGSITIAVRCAGVLGGDNCPLNGKLRESFVHTVKDTSVRRFYDELKIARGYAMEFGNVRVSVSGVTVDPGEADRKRLTEDGTSVIIVGPNRGG
jgi:hypothetical protein